METTLQTRIYFATMPKTPSDPIDANNTKGEPDPGNADNRVKGINFIMFLDAVARIYGTEAKQRLEKEASGELGDALRFGGIVAGGWYNIGLCKYRLSNPSAIDDANPAHIRRETHFPELLRERSARRPRE
jgi:hypothetical protein